jgi:hypothetical protein
VDIIQPDVGHIGGIRETRRLVATAETHYMLVAPHNVGRPALTAASLQVGFTAPNFKILEHFNDFPDAEIKKVIRGTPQAVDPEDGWFHLSREPGLGVELDVDAAAGVPQQRPHFDLWAEGWERRKPKGTRGRRPGARGCQWAPRSSSRLRVGTGWRCMSPASRRSARPWSGARLRYLRQRTRAAHLRCGNAADAAICRSSA